MATTYLTRTLGTPTNQKIWTWSAWVKRCNLVSNFENAMFGAGNDSTLRAVFRFNAHQLNFQDTVNNVNIQTNALFRDLSAWYHIVARVDTTQATTTDRVKLYVNGQQITSFSQATWGTQNMNMTFNSNVIHYINARWSGSVNSIADMIYAHVHFIDGTAYDASTFGETDSTTGQWKPKISPSVTYGNNGFFLKFANSGSMGTDSSGNGNNFTVAAGTLTQTQDTPSNVFATFNPLDNRLGASTQTLIIPTLSNGNLQATGTSSTLACVCNSTLAINNGKYYAEYKISFKNSSIVRVGITSKSKWDGSSFPTSQTDTAYSYSSTGSTEHNGTASSYGDSYTTGDIIGVAFDCTNGNLEFYKNGVSQGVAFTGISSNQDWCFTFLPLQDDIGQANFGNGYFGTTAVSSAQSPSDGIGIFEYAVPSGYKALCTKSINAQEYS